MATFAEQTETLREWAADFAEADRLAGIHRDMPGFGEAWTQWLGLVGRYRTAVLRHYGARSHRRGGGLETRDAILAALDGLEGAVAAARGPFDPERPHVRGWTRVIEAAQHVLAALPRAPA